MSAIVAGVVGALLFALGWWRGYAAQTDLRRRRDDADAAAVAALRRAVKAEDAGTRLAVRVDALRKAAQRVADSTQCHEVYNGETPCNLCELRRVLADAGAM